MPGVEFVPAPAAPRPWTVEDLEYEALPLWIATCGERVAAVTMRGPEALADYARGAGTTLAGSGRAQPSAAHRQLTEYLAGARQTFELEILTNRRASAFEVAAWEALCAIPFGEVRSYGEQARMLGNAGAARAVGRANSRNPAGIVVPCHRIIGSDGSLTGFAGGLSRKRWLLAHEGVRLGAAAGPAMPVADTQLRLAF